MLTVSFAAFAVTAEENEQLLKTSLFEQKKEQFNPENKAGRRQKKQNKTKE